MTDAAPSPRQERENTLLREDIEEAMALYEFTREDRIANYGYTSAYYLLGFITRPQLRALIDLLGITYEEQARIRVSSTKTAPSPSGMPLPAGVPSPSGAPPTPQQEVEYAALRADIEGAMAAPGFTRDEQLARYGYVNAFYTLGFITLPQFQALVERLGITVEEQDDLHV